MVITVQEFIYLLNLKLIQIKSLKLIKKKEIKNMLFIHSVAKYLTVLDVVKKMGLKLFNGNSMEEKINYGISVILKI
jgi:hypothetical protein